MKNLKTVLFLVCLISYSFCNAQHKIGDAEFPETINFKSQELIYNGAGTRKFAWLKLYSCALYLKEKSNDARHIITDNETMVIKLQSTSRFVTNSRLLKSLDKSFELSTKTVDEDVSTQIEKFRSFFIQDIDINDNFDIVYLENSGIKIYKNGDFKGSISGMPFKQALFGIWLGTEHTNKYMKKLKDEMLGN